MSALGIIQIRTCTAKRVYRHCLIGSPMKIWTAECTYYHKITAKEKEWERKENVCFSGWRYKKQWSVSPVVVTDFVIKLLFEFWVLLKVLICSHRAELFLITPTHTCKDMHENLELTELYRIELCIRQTC